VVQQQWQQQHATSHEKAVKCPEEMRDNGVKEFPDPDASGDSSVGPRVAARIPEEGSLRFKHRRASILAPHHARVAAAAARRPR